MLCKQNFLVHKFLDAFRSHKALLDVDPASQRGSLPFAVALRMPNGDVDQFAMLVELCYCDPPTAVEACETAPHVISPPLKISAARLSTGRGALPVTSDYPCLTSALEPGQKIRIPLDFDPDHLSFAVTIVRKRDGKCKRIFQFPSRSEEFFNVEDNAILFDCPSAREIAHRDPTIHYLTRCEAGLQIHLGIARDTDAYQAECVDVYSYSDAGELLEDGIRETLLRIEHVGIWF